jgi:uncharacterized hydrophobic protein (TIGR00341 family)
MKYLEVVADIQSAATIGKIAEKAKARDFRLGPVGDDNMRQMRMLVSDDHLQLALDTLQNVLGAQTTSTIVVLPIETSLPVPDEEQRREEDAATAAREALYEAVEQNAQLDLNYLVLVLLSTIVAGIGLIENNVAVVIGAMVIAPLLGPNLALSLGTALGDLALMFKAARTLFAGIAVSVFLSVVLGFFWPSELDSTELVDRTRAGLDSVALALASGAAAALSLTSGLSSVLVGVMVAVALLPPAATLGLFLGAGRFDPAIGAGLLLAVNIVCVNLASKMVFFFKKIRPRGWLEKETAKWAMLTYVLVWVGSLVILMAIAYARRSLDHGALVQ